MSVCVDHGEHMEPISQFNSSDKDGGASLVDWIFNYPPAPRSLKRPKLYTHEMNKSLSPGHAVAMAMRRWLIVDVGHVFRAVPGQRLLLLLVWKIPNQIRFQLFLRPAQLRGKHFVVDVIRFAGRHRSSVVRRIALAARRMATQIRFRLLLLLLLDLDVGWTAIDD